VDACIEELLGKYRPHDRAKPRRAARTTRSGAGLTVTVTTTRPRFTRGTHQSTQRGRASSFRKCGRMSAVMTPRTIDWRVTARRGRPHTKLFREERERPVWLLADLGAAMFSARGANSIERRRQGRRARRLECRTGGRSSRSAPRRGGSSYRIPAPPCPRSRSTSAPATANRHATHRSIVAAFRLHERRRKRADAVSASGEHGDRVSDFATLDSDTAGHGRTRCS